MFSSKVALMKKIEIKMDLFRNFDSEHLPRKAWNRRPDCKLRELNR